MFDARAGTQRRRELRDEPGGPRGPVLALDLGGTQIRAAAVRPDGSIEARIARHTPVPEGPEAIVRACLETLRASRAELQANDPDAEATLIGISISSPGPIDPWRGVIVEPPNLGPEFLDVPLAARAVRSRMARPLTWPNTRGPTGSGTSTPAMSPSPRTPASRPRMRSWKRLGARSLPRASAGWTISIRT